MHTFEEPKAVAPWFVGLLSHHWFHLEQELNSLEFTTCFYIIGRFGLRWGSERGARHCALEKMVVVRREGMSVTRCPLQSPWLFSQPAWNNPGPCIYIVLSKYTVHPFHDLHIHLCFWRCSWFENLSACRVQAFPFFGGPPWIVTFGGINQIWSQTDSGHRMSAFLAKGIWGVLFWLVSGGPGFGSMKEARFRAVSGLGTVPTWSSHRHFRLKNPKLPQDLRRKMRGLRISILRNQRSRTLMRPKPGQ